MTRMYFDFWLRR